MYRIADLMTRTLVTLRESDDLTLADDILELGRFRHLPVVGDRGQLVGLITHRDLLRLFAERVGRDRHAILAREVCATAMFENARAMHHR